MDSYHKIPGATPADRFSYPVAERLSATRLSLLRAAHARESKYLLGDMTTVQTETITDLQKTLHLQLGRLARKDGKLQASINAITAVQNLELGTAGSDDANDEFGHVLWAQKEHALAIQHLEQMTGVIPPGQQVNGRLAMLLAQTVSAST
jgi:ataxia telangiectasia mutated family protein